MNKNLVNMYGNIAQLENLPFCNIIKVDRKGLWVEVLIRNGKYKILCDYQLTGHMDVYLVEPDINMDNPTEIHTYGMKYHKAYKRELPNLCLRLPYRFQWNSSILLLDSYIPWAAEWTEFYEIWELTGKWHGGGEHPTSEGRHDDEENNNFYRPFNYSNSYGNRISGI